MKFDFATKKHPGPCELRWYTVECATEKEAMERARAQADKDRAALYAGPLQRKEQPSNAERNSK